MESVNEYILSLSPEEKLAMEIAKSQLKTSFNLQKSIGYIKFMSKKANDEKYIKIHDN